MLVTSAISFNIMEEIKRGCSSHLSISGMDANEVVKVSLGSPKLEADGEALGNLSSIRPKDVESNHFLLSTTNEWISN